MWQWDLWSGGGFPSLCRSCLTRIEGIIAVNCVLEPILFPTRPGALNIHRFSSHNLIVSSHMHVIREVRQVRGIIPTLYQLPLLSSHPLIPIGYGGQDRCFQDHVFRQFQKIAVIQSQAHPHVAPVQQQVFRSIVTDLTIAEAAILALTSLTKWLMGFMPG